MQVRLHEIEHQVQILVIFRLNDILQSDDISMVSHLLQEHNFPESALGISSIMESIEYLLQGNSLLSLLIACFPDYSVSALPQLLLYVVLLKNMWLDFISHFNQLNFIF
jgi:hypothetical protein